MTTSELQVQCRTSCVVSPSNLLSVRSATVIFVSPKLTGFCFKALKSVLVRMIFRVIAPLAGCRDRANHCVRLVNNVQHSDKFQNVSGDVSRISLCLLSHPCVTDINLPNGSGAEAVMVKHSAKLCGLFSRMLPFQSGMFDTFENKGQKTFAKIFFLPQLGQSDWTRCGTIERSVDKSCSLDGNQL